jgi:hypothetical protein
MPHEAGVQGRDSKQHIGDQTAQQQCCLMRAIAKRAIPDLGICLLWGGSSGGGSL